MNAKIPASAVHHKDAAHACGMTGVHESIIVRVGIRSRLMPDHRSKRGMKNEGADSRALVFLLAFAGRFFALHTAEDLHNRIQILQ